MRYRYHTLDVFTDRISGGHPLAVFPDARGLSGDQMQQIARELNLSETVFLLPPETSGATPQVRIFTPGTELPVRVGEGVVEVAGEPAAAADRRGWEPVALPGVAAPVGAYSRAVRAGELLFVSGQVPRDPRTGELQGEDVAAQTRAVLENVRRVLEAAGAGLEDVVSVTAYLADIGEWETFNRVYREVLQPPYPSRTTVGAQLHGVLVEISVVARVRA